MASEAWANEYNAKLNTLHSIEAQAQSAKEKLNESAKTKVPAVLTAVELNVLAERIKAQEDFLKIAQNPY